MPFPEPFRFVLCTSKQTHEWTMNTKKTAQQDVVAGRRRRHRSGTTTPASSSVSTPTSSCVTQQQQTVHSYLPGGITILQSSLEWQRNNKDWSAKNADFATNWLPWQRPLSDLQMNAGFVQPFHCSTNLENLVKIGPVVPEKSLLIGRPHAHRKQDCPNHRYNHGWKVGGEHTSGECRFLPFPPRSIPLFSFSCCYLPNHPFTHSLSAPTGASNPPLWVGDQPPHPTK